MKRRDILAALPLGILSTVSTGCAPTDPGDKDVSDQTAKVSARKLEQFGLQLSTVTPQLMADFEGTLAQVAAIGYRQVEFSALGFLGRPVSMIAELLEAHGLTAPVGRISPKLPEGFATLSREQQMAAFRTYAGPEYLLDNIRYGLEGAARLNQKHLVLPALMPNNFATQAKIDESIELLRQAGELCATAGVQFGYHNHDWEFKAIEGVVPFDLMLETIEPDLMASQLDVYWVTKGGRDPLDYFALHSDRIPSCHLKDMDSDGDFADVGYGTIDFPAVVAAAMGAGTEYYFVERDGPPEPMNTAKRAYAYLNEMTY